MRLAFFHLSLVIVWKYISFSTSDFQVLVYNAFDFNRQTMAKINIHRYIVNVLRSIFLGFFFLFFLLHVTWLSRVMLDNDHSSLHIWLFSKSCQKNYEGKRVLHLVFVMIRPPEEITRHWTSRLLIGSDSFTFVFFMYSAIEQVNSFIIMIKVFFYQSNANDWQMNEWHWTYSTVRWFSIFSVQM